MTTTLTPIRLGRISGLLEGEGSFMWTHEAPVISVAMCDHDVMQQIADSLGGTLYGPRQPKGKPTYLPIWTCRIHGSHAIGWMMTLYTLMGERRKAKIRDIIAKWKAAPNFPRAKRGERSEATCHPDRPRAGGGLCMSCYMRTHRKERGYRTSSEQRKLEKDPTYVSRRPKAMATCHPDRVAQAKGLCSTCYVKQWTAAHPEARAQKNAKSLARYYARKKRATPGGTELFPPPASSSSMT